MLTDTLTLWGNKEIQSNPGVQDTGVSHTGVTDTGIQDTGVSHTGVSHTGVTDTGVSHTGVTDTGVQDTGVPDTGVQDTHTGWRRTHDAVFCGPMLHPQTTRIGCTSSKNQCLTFQIQHVDITWRLVLAAAQ